MECENPLKGSAVRAHLFSGGRSTGEEAAWCEGSMPGFGALGCATGLGRLAQVRRPGHCFQVIQSSN